ncbi:hypothetical protein CsSME_00052539 [Camellia sinensis var. sinensis]|uniref:Uncharacterized protein n=1 Tax=Camellia sinensis TaxID=4442 RepID=A0A7J7FXB4_CAMSI|nr:hypothetical protein HYC85_028419 [Camellia sinensis]
MERNRQLNETPTCLNYSTRLSSTGAYFSTICYVPLYSALIGPNRSTQRADLQLGYLISAPTLSNKR